VNREYAASVLARYRSSVEQAQTLQKTQPIWSGERRAALRAADEMVPYVNAVLHNLLANIPPIYTGYVAAHVANLNRLDRTLGTLLGTWKAMEVTGPGGVAVLPPYLPFWAMDPIVSSAASMWEKGKFRQAVADAAGKLNGLTQERLGVRDISDYNLMAAAFNPKEPVKGRPRLRPPRSNSSQDTVTSLKEGAHRMAMGVMMAIRDPAAHETGDGNPITCAEQLATLSMVARWVRNWDVVRYVEPIDTSSISPVLAAYQKNVAQQLRLATLPPQPQRAALPRATQAGSESAD
jgi:Protein of unknown function (Hypoth_ymh)